MALALGTQAPAFSLRDSDKNIVTLDGQKGKNVLLLFFPMAFTGTCTKELCSMRDNIAVYDGLDAQVFGISVDSVFSLGKFKAEQNLNFPLLSDFNKTASRAYDSIYENWILEMDGVSKRSAYVIDKEGMVRYAEVLEDPTQIPDFDAIKKCLEHINM